MIERPRYYDRQGNPIPGDNVMEWASLYEHDSRVVSQDEIRGHLVSTVWLGIDHNFWGDGPPLIFETMIFCEDGCPNRGVDCPWEDYQVRYATEEQALGGHKQAVAEVRDKVKVPGGWEPPSEDMGG